MGACQWSDTLSGFVTDQPSTFMQNQAPCSLRDDLPKFTRSPADAELRFHIFSTFLDGKIAESIAHGRAQKVTNADSLSRSDTFLQISPEKVQLQDKA